MMKNLLLTLLILFSLSASAQRNLPSKQFNTITDLRVQGGTSGTVVNVSGLVTATDKNGGNYYWDATSTVADDGISVIKVTNITTGRWIKMLNDNTIKGRQVFSGLLQTAYPISFGQTLPVTPALIIVQAYSLNASVPTWISNVTTTGFTLNFNALPVIGTNNLDVGWLVIKQ